MMTGLPSKALLLTSSMAFYPFPLLLPALPMRGLRLVSPHTHLEPRMSVSNKSFDRDDGWEARQRLPMILTRFSSLDRDPL